MMAVGKDSVEVIEFMTLYEKLKDWVNDKPEALHELCKTDEAIKDICDKLFWAAFTLSMAERDARQLFATPVDPNFVAIWRDYEERYEPVLAWLWLGDLPTEMTEGQPYKGSKADLQWENADTGAAECAKSITDAIDFAVEQVGDPSRNFPDDFYDDIEEGGRNWHRLQTRVGFDPRGVFRRRELVPLILVPRHVASGMGASDKVSLYTNLQQAHDTFIFGAPYAALALMRSILEATLRDHYHAKGKNLERRIQNVEERLPDGASAAALHRIRRRANSIMHLDIDSDATLPMIEGAELEKEIASLLLALRTLIERAPKR